MALHGETQYLLFKANNNKVGTEQGVRPSGYGAESRNRRIKCYLSDINTPSAVIIFFINDLLTIM